MKRIGWVDVAKGIGIILVILGHMPTIPILIRLWIFSFHMPLFFFVSGYLYNVKDESISLNSLLKKKTRKILKPYVIFSILFVLLDYLVLNISLDETKTRLIRFVFGQGGYDILWFFFSLFIAETLYCLIQRYSKNKTLIIVLLVTTGIILSHYRVGQIWKISTSMVALMFYSLGRCFRNKELAIHITHSNIAFVASLILNLVICAFCISKCGYVIDMNNSKYAMGPISLLAAIAGIIVVYQISIIIDEWRVSTPLKFIGSYSLFFFPITGYAPNFIATYLSRYIPITSIIKILAKIAGLAIAALVSYVYSNREKALSYRHD